MRCEADQYHDHQRLDAGDRVSRRGCCFDPGSPGVGRGTGLRRRPRAHATGGGAPGAGAGVDREGLDVDAGIAIEPRARAVYLTPSHQYPLGATMTASRRLQALAWAQSSGAWIFEDDYDSEYRYGNQPSRVPSGSRPRRPRGVHRHLQQGAVSCVARRLHRNSGGPRGALRKRPRRHGHLPAEPGAERSRRIFSARVTFARHVRKMRALYAERRSVLAASLHEELGDHLELLGDQAGMHIVAAFRTEVDDRLLAETAASQGLWAMPLSSCYPRPTRAARPRPWLRGTPKRT